MHLAFDPQFLAQELLKPLVSLVILPKSLCPKSVYAIEMTVLGPSFRLGAGDREPKQLLKALEIEFSNPWLTSLSPAPVRKPLGW